MSTGDILCHLRALGYSRFKLIDQKTHFSLSSGPFAEETCGAWRSVDDVYYEWLHLQRGHHDRCELVDAKHEGAWYDVHAAL